ncbi:PREDICTED: uncharacterized protein LOC104603877 [Nelumbo nucifera]|uniref:Protein BPS1, chloroplastic-like n=2 Tax=Nelumbo nucifera TaxID=4432 RepID=A0A822Z5V7_NELNU|nr:PREDICTED: uncharacterized protein LOC104603877 [Nelumbo nucifera]DAD41774.1 TPA_asm: hypothetical protein HUJ06_016097 [Nelumbo nucifera]
MVVSIVIPKSACHVRSASFPSVSHPLMLRIEKKLKELRGSLPSSPGGTVESLCDGLRGLADLLESVQESLQSPFARQALVHGRQDKWVDEVLDGSLTLLDVSGTTRDVLLQMKEEMQTVQSTLRRRKNAELDLEGSIAAYMFSRKTVNKVIHKCLGDVKRMERTQYSTSSVLDKNQDLVVMASMLKEVEGIALILLDSILSFIAAPKTRTGWSLVSKLIMYNRRSACEPELMVANEVDKIDLALCALTGRRSSCKESDVVNLQNVQKCLKVLEMRMGSLDDCLECVFRHLIKTRVSLLNILNQ